MADGTNSNLWLLVSVSHRSERSGRRAVGAGELRSGGRPHRGLQAQTSSACAGRRTDPAHGAACQGFLCLDELLSVCPSGGGTASGRALPAEEAGTLFRLHHLAILALQTAVSPAPSHTSTNRSPALRQR